MSSATTSPADASRTPRQYAERALSSVGGRAKDWNSQFRRRLLDAIEREVAEAVRAAVKAMET